MQTQQETWGHIVMYMSYYTVFIFVFALSLYVNVIYISHLCYLPFNFTFW